MAGDRYRETHDLAYADHKTFYPVRIPVSHWQLRHYISSPAPGGKLYYASGHDIYCLSTGEHGGSRKRRLIATLPFEARCTASGFGWVCVGGEVDGHFAAIKLDPRTTGRGVDDALDVHIGGGPETEAGEGETMPRRAASVKVERIGEEIVNSISIHRIQDEAAHLDDIVAVLTNNDKTVRLYSLPGNLETSVLDLVFPINHATLSPDGRLLVAVGDYNQAFFFERELQDTPPQIPKPHNRLTSASIKWKLRNVVNLHISGPESTTGYFTTSWSHNGHLVAVGSEGGYVTVFDVDMLLDPEIEDSKAVMAVMPGSRPDCPPPHPGAIRSMLFAPDPWDLLIWAEDQGRVCIGDLRTGLRTRQVVILEPKDEDLKRMTYEDVTVDEHVASSSTPTRHMDELEADFMRRYREAPTHAAAVNFATEYIEARRRQRQQRQDRAELRDLRAAMMAAPNQTDSTTAALLDDDPQGLTAREQQILETLRTTRQREEARAAGGGTGPPSSVNYTSSDMFRNSTNARANADAASTSGETNSRPPSVAEVLNMVQDSFPELARTNAASPRPTSSRGNDSASSLAAISSLQEAAWGAGRSRRPIVGIVPSNNNDEPRQVPRRSASVVLTPPRSDGLSSPAASSDAATGNGRTSQQGQDEHGDNPWRVIEEHMSLARGPLFESAAGRETSNNSTTNVAASSSTTASPLLNLNESDLQTELAAERARARALAIQRERWRTLRATETPSNDGSSNAITPNTGSTVAALHALEAARAEITSNASRRVRNSNTTQAVPPAATSANSTAITPSTTTNTTTTASMLPPGLAIAGINAYESRRSQFLRTGGYSGREIGVRTAGLAMSEDGRTLWAACEEGIFQIDINVKRRLFWGSVEVR